MMSIIDQVEKAIHLHLPDPAKTQDQDGSGMLIVAVSGGPDSLCLLHLLCQEDLYPRDLIIAAHLNHRLRDSAAAESKFVLDFAARLGVQAVTRSADVASIARHEGLSIEEAGRQTRYRFLTDVAEKHQATFIVTGHHADDQVETILMHFLRGTGIEGLRGMQPVYPLHGEPGIMVFRPLLQVTRQEIEAYNQANDLHPVIDETNIDTSYYRNRLRHDLLPLLEQYNTGVRERLVNMAAVISGEEQVIANVVDQAWEQLLDESHTDWITLDRSRLAEYPIAIQRRLLRKAVLTLRPGLRNLGFRTTEQARLVAINGEVGSESTLPAGMLLLVQYDQLLISAVGTESPVPDLPQLAELKEVDLPVPGNIELAGGWRLTARLVNELEMDKVEDNQDPWRAILSLAAINDLVLRPRRPGERFQPLGMATGTARVSRVMIDRKVPQSLRKRWPIVASRRHLLWLVGHHIDERARIGSGHPIMIEFRVYREETGS